MSKIVKIGSIEFKEADIRLVTVSKPISIWLVAIELDDGVTIVTKCATEEVALDLRTTIKEFLDEGYKGSRLDIQQNASNLGCYDRSYS